MAGKLVRVKNQSPIAPKQKKEVEKRKVLLREVEKWNDRNMVDMYEQEDVPKKKTFILDGSECSSCNHVMTNAAKFCSECGSKMETAGTGATAFIEHKTEKKVA